MAERCCILVPAMASNMCEGTGLVPRDKFGRPVHTSALLRRRPPMFVSTSQRTKGLQLITDLTSRLNALEWLPILLIRLIEGIVFVDSGRHKLFSDLAGFGNLDRKSTRLNSSH